MARYKQYTYEQEIMIPAGFTKQIVPGTLPFYLSGNYDGIDFCIYNHYNIQME